MKHDLGGGIALFKNRFLRIYFALFQSNKILLQIHSRTSAMVSKDGEL